MTDSYLTTSVKPLLVALLGLAIVVMLGAAIIAYTVPSARGEVLRDPAGTTELSTWQLVD